MLLSAASAKTNILVTIGVAALVILLPLIDSRVCRAAGVNLNHRMTGRSREIRLLRLRRVILFLLFFVYMLVNVYLVFFSRSASADYQIHVDPLNDVINSVSIDTGILGILADIYAKGLSGGLSHIRIEKLEDLTQIYMNIMLFVPLGYLLPYVFDWFSAKVRYRPVLFCFLYSFAVENLQLVFKRGFYDVDDLISNTVGGLLGQLFYMSVAFFATHPGWKEDLKQYRKWRHRARRRVLYPFAKQSGFARTTIIASDVDTSWDFYVVELGFRPVRQIVYENPPETSLLLSLGKFQLEIICPDGVEDIGEQHFAISVENITKLKRRLDKRGFDVGDYKEDVYTGLRCLSINDPDCVQITFIEA